MLSTKESNASDCALMQSRLTINNLWINKVNKVPFNRIIHDIQMSAVYEYKECAKKIETT